MLSEKRPSTFQILRVFYLLQNEKIILKKYSEKFEISIRTAKRDICMIKELFNLNINYDRKLGCYVNEDAKIIFDKNFFY